jgi:hypothetical protein
MIFLADSSLDHGSIASHSLFCLVFQPRWSSSKADCLARVLLYYEESILRSKRPETAWTGYMSLYKLTQIPNYGWVAILPALSLKTQAIISKVRRHLVAWSRYEPFPTGIQPQYSNMYSIRTCLISSQTLWRYYLPTRLLRLSLKASFVKPSEICPHSECKHIQILTQYAPADTPSGSVRI